MHLEPVFQEKLPNPLFNYKQWHLQFPPNPFPSPPFWPQVLFEYYLEPEAAADKRFVAASLAASDQVQQEDIQLCESVQRGLRSPAYSTGRCAAGRAPGARWPWRVFWRLSESWLLTAG